MKFIVYVVCLILIAAVAISIDRFYSQLMAYTQQGITLKDYELNDLKGFDSLDEENVLQRLVGKIDERYSEIAKTEKDLKLYNLVISFAVVILTGLAAFFTSMQNLRNSLDLKKKLGVWVLILTFVSTLGNSAGLHLNSEIESVNGRIRKASELRESLFVDYNSYKENRSDLSTLKLRYESYIKAL